MKKLLITGLLLVTVLSVKAQSYIGFLTDNYSGVHGVISNPANIVDSRFRTDINLFGISAAINNDYLGASINEVFDDDYDFDDDGARFPEDNNNLNFNIDVLGPAFMFNINERNSIAVFSRARTFFNVNDVDGETLEGLVEDLDDNISFDITEEGAYATGNSWVEIGLTYARVLMNKEQHFLKGGLSVKYLQGLGNAYAIAENVSVDFDANDVIQGNGTVETSGNVTYAYSDNFEEGLDDADIESVSGASGVGFDLGFVYEWRPDYKDQVTTDSKGNTYTLKDINKYKLKFGLSITDIGSIAYDGTEERYDFNNTLSQNDFEDIDIDELDRFYNQISSENTENATLPTALHLNADWNINNKFYVNLNGDVSLIAKDNVNSNRISNLVSLTPRFERKWFSFYMPLSMMQYSGFNWGAGLRAGPLYIGSGSVLTVLMNDEAKAADVYMGLKIPVYQSRLKDKDGDGVLDKVDDCPEEAGPEENYGCPWPDTDGDGLLDKDDDCPEEVGPEENKGCPWPDTDGDGLLDKDDDCPNESGPTANKGCPWPDTDGDGVLDRDDQCIDVVGTMVNNGCPEVTEEIQKTLNEYAAQILFDSGKATIKPVSDAKLKEILAILAEYPTAKFSVEGHTDSAGSSASNQRLSDSRANAVKTYLVDNGVDQFRLSATGFGEDRPIATNKTRAGRAQNRRVEINLVK